MDPDIIVRKFSENIYVTEAHDLDTVVLENKDTADFVSILATNFKKSMNTNVQFTTYALNPTDTAIVAGKTLWDASSGMLAIGRDDGLSVMRINEGVQTPVKFVEAVSIGNPLYLVSQDGNFPTVGKAIGSDVSKNKVIGFASENCAINTVGHMCSFGTIVNVNSSVFVTGQVLSAGDKLYLSSDGKLSNVRPSSGETRYVLAVVLSTANNTILCNATYQKDYALLSDLAELAGTGWTNENLTNHESRLDTLEGNSSVENSVDEKIKTQAEDADLTDVENRFASSTIKSGLAELAGIGRTSETVKQNADDIDSLETRATNLETAETAVKGVGWTDENLVDHETRIAANEGTLSNHESRVSTNEDRLTDIEANDMAIDGDKTFSGETSFTSTSHMKVPVGTTAQRPTSPTDGYLRYNTDLKTFEGYNNGVWGSVGGGQMFGMSSVKAISFNAQTIAENILVTGNVNAYSVGTITIEDGYTVTIDDGSVYKIL